MSHKKRQFVGILALTLLVSLLLACGSPKATPTPEPTNTPPPTNTPVPTNTPIPTNTPPPPTNTPVPTPTNTLAPTNTPEPTPTTEAAQPGTDTSDLPVGLVIVSHDGFFDESDNAHVVGEVLNNDTVNYQYIEIKVGLYDKDDKFLDEKTTYAYIDILEPGEKSPFELVLWEPPAGLDTYKVEAFGDKTTDVLVPGLEFVQYIENLDDNGNWTLIGEVTNNGDMTASFVEVAATIYDIDDNVVDVGYTTVERSVMAPGSITPFELYIGEINGDPDHFEIVVSGDEVDDWQLEDRAAVELVTINYIIDTFDDLVVIGEVKNSDDTNIEFIKTFASFYDENDEIVAVEWGYAWADYLPPGEVTPFKIDLFSTPENVDHWTVWVQASKTEDPVEGQLTISEYDNTIDDDYLATFTGTILNAGKDAMEYLEIAVTIYDAEGRVVAVDWDYLEGELAPDGTMTFEFDVQTNEDADRFELYVQGSVVD